MRLRSRAASLLKRLNASQNLILKSGRVAGRVGEVAVDPGSAVGRLAGDIAGKVGADRIEIPRQNLDDVAPPTTAYEMVADEAFKGRV